MARYREEAEREALEKAKKEGGASSIETIPKACPICKGDVKGDDIYLYFCKRCNILFKRHELAMTEERIEDTLKKKLAEKYAGELDIEDTKIPLKRIFSSKSKVSIKSSKGKRKESKSKQRDDPSALPEVPPPAKYIASKNSNVLHAYNCPFAQNIKESSRILLNDLSKAKKYKKCKCIK